MQLLAPIAAALLCALQQDPLPEAARNQDGKWMPPICMDGLPESVCRDIRAAEERVLQAPTDPEAAGELGAILYGNQLHCDAAACFARAAALDREPQRWLYYCGLSHQKAQRIPEAIAAFDRASQADHGYAPLLLALSTLLVESDPERALQLSRRAVELDGKLAVAHASLGRLASIQGRDEEALAHFRRAVELEPALSTAHYELAMLLRAAGKTEEANEHLRLFEAGGSPTGSDPWREDLDRMARSPRTIKNAVVFLWQAGRNDEARTLLEEELRDHPEHEGLRDLLGETYARLRLDEQAVEQFRLVLESGPSNVEVKSKLAQSLANLGKAEEAESLLRAALEQRPDSGLVLQQLAQVLAGQGRRDEALALLRRAVAAQPKDERLRIELARALTRAGDREGAMEQLRVLLDIAPRSVPGHVLLGGLLKDAGDFAAADAHFEAALATDPLVAQAYLELADSALRSGSPARARQNLERGLERLPTSSALLCRLAWQLATCPDAAQRDGPRAVRLAEQACFEAARPAPECLDALAAAYAEVGRFADAVQAQRKAIRAAVQSERPDPGDYRQRVALYSSGRPYREPRP